MNRENRWLLPEGVDELTPPETWRLESLRRKLLDLYDSWGYELVMPPFVEFLESLLTGTGRDLELQTFKLIDQLSGRTLGVRADMTPQVARIDAHSLQQTGPTRLCYMGTVLHTRTDDFGGSRAPLQVGAELYGHSGDASDLEIIQLMLATLDAAVIDSIYLDLSHVGIFRGLVQQLQLSQSQEAQLFEILQRKALPDLDSWLAALNLSPQAATMLRALATLHGDEAILPLARQHLAEAPASVHQALDTLEHISKAVRRRHSALPIHLDLAELRGYHYHTGLVFAVYVAGQGQEIARGGRYDEIGAVFGRARPATGFSADLKTLLALSRQPVADAAGIYAPAPDPDDQALEQLIDQLRAQGQRVIRALADTSDAAIDPASLGCDRILQQLNEGWCVQTLDSYAVTQP